MASVRVKLSAKSSGVPDGSSPLLRGRDTHECGVSWVSGDAFKTVEAFPRTIRRGEVLSKGDGIRPSGTPGRPETPRLVRLGLGLQVVG